MAFPILSAGFSFNSHIGGGGWGGNFGNCCNNILGPNRGGLFGALAGGLIGSILGGCNPLMGILGATVGGLLGNTMGAQQQGCYGSHQHPGHQHCGSYPPSYGNCFGGPQYGGYNQPMNGCYPGGNNVNINFGNQFCPPSQCGCCNGGGRQMGQLCQDGKGKPITYTTSGGYQVTVDKHDISIKDPQGKNVLKHWGDPHENLNGKHLKDWEGKQRSVILADGTKITMTADGPHGVTQNTSIYDGRQNVQIANAQNKIEHHSYNPFDTMFREMNQYDGETALFRTNWNGAAVYNNIYNQDANFNVTNAYRQIGRTGGYNNPNKVHDFYDDPRIGHT